MKVVVNEIDVGKLGEKYASEKVSVHHTTEKVGRVTVDGCLAGFGGMMDEKTKALIYACNEILMNIYDTGSDSHPDTGETYEDVKQLEEALSAFEEK